MPYALVKGLEGDSEEGRVCLLPLYDIADKVRYFWSWDMQLERQR